MAFDPSTAVLEFDPSSATEDDFSFDPSSAVDTTPGIVKDTYNRAMGGLTIGLTKAAAGTARWAEMVTKASSTLSGAISEKADIPIGPLPASAASELGGAVSKQFGSVAQTLEEKTKEFEAYKESQTDRSRDSKFSAQLVEAGGNFAGQIALTAAGRVPGIIANVGQMFEQEYSAAKAQGKDDLLAYQAGVSNMPAAFLDYFMESKIAKSLVPVKRTVGTVAKKLFTNAGLEGATEVLQDEYSNWIAGNALKYDESRSVQERFSAANLPETGKQIATTFAIGSILGGTATGAFEAIQPSQVDEKGLAKESRLDALQKELDLINETQEKAQISTTESSPIVPTTISETTGDTPATPVSEVARVSPEVRQEALDTEAEESLSAAERVLAEPTVEEPTQMSLGTSDAVPVAPITEKQPITQPKAIPGIPSETDLKKVDVLKRATDVIREGWQHAPQIEVVHDVTSIPDEAMTPAEKEAIQGKTADGLFGKDGKVYLIGQSVPSIQRAKEIILHETKAHYGFKSLFGSDESSYRKAMQSALDEFDARPKLADALAQRGGFKDLADLTQSYSHLNIEHKEGKYALTEELLSRAAEVYHDPAKERPTWFNRVISRIKVALQPLMPGMRLNDQDIVNLLGTKSTELLDVASQKVETGQADIPKFSIVKGFEPPEFIPIPFVDVGDRLTTSKSRNTGEEQEYLRFKTPVGWAKVLGSRLSGFVSKDKKILFGYDKNGQMFTVNPKDVKPSDVLGDHETANRLRDALGKMPFHSETGKAEIPKFSIGAPQLSLTRKQKQVDYYKNLATNQFPSIPEESANSLAKFLSENKTVMQSEEYLPDEAMQMAVRAYIRHNKTPYDDIFNEGVDKSENRSIVGSKIDKIYNEWRKGFEKPKEENIKPLYWAEYTKLDGTRNKIYSSSQELLRSKIEDAQKKHTNHDLNPVFGSDTETTKFSLTKTPAPAVHIGDQEFEGQKFPFFNLTEAIPGHSKDSTVSTDTLIAEGFGPPEGYTGEFKTSDLPKLSLTKDPPLRRFSERQKENEHFEQIGMADLVEKIDSNYQAVSNKEGSEAAVKTLSEVGISEAMDRIDSSQTINARERQYLGIAAMEYWNNVAAKAESQEDLDIASRNMVHVVESLARRGTEYGQAIQAMRGRLTPEGWIRTTLNQFKEAQAPMRRAGKEIVDGVKDAVGSKEKQIKEAVENKPRIKKLVEDFEKKSIDSAKKEILSLKDIIFDSAKNKQLTVEALSKKLVDESGLTGKEAEVLSKAIISAANSQIGQQAASYINRLKKTSSADKKIVKAMKDDITKIMDYSISGVLDEETLYNHLAEKLKLPFYDTKLIQEIKTEAERIKDDELLNKSPMLKNKAIHDLGNKIAKRTGTSNYDIAQSYWYASVLSGIRTQLKNFVGTGVQGQINNFLLSADALKRGQSGEINAIYSGWLEGLQKGVAAASDALIRGDFTGQYSFEAQRAANALENISDSPEKWKRILSNFKYVSRLMVAADILNASANSESRIRLKAYQLTGDLNQSKEDRQKAIKELLHTTSDEIKTAQLQAEKEGFKPESSTFKRRVNEILELQRPSDLVSEAKAYGLSSTYNSEPNPNTVLGTLANFIESSIAAGNRSESTIANVSAKAARYLIPFTRIVANVGNEQLNYTPVGLLRLATLNHFQKGITQSDTDLTLLRAKVLLGNGALIGLASILSQWDDDENPPIQIVGAGPSNPEKKKQWLAAGNKPWSIIWRDSKGTKHSATYAYTPFAMMLGTLGSYKDAQRYGNIDEKSAITKLASAVSGGAVVITDASFLSGVTSLMDVYSRRKDVETFSKGLVSQVARTAGGLVPNLLKEVDSWWNKPLRDTKASSFELGAIFANQVPVIKDVVGKPMLNILGEEVSNPKYPWEPILQTKELSDIWRVIDSKQNDGVFISLPDAATKVLSNGKRQTMNNLELYEYRKVYGQEMKKAITENLSLFEKADPEMSKKILDSWSSTAREAAKSKMKFFQ